MTRSWLPGAAALLAGAMVFSSPPADAHRTIVSPYTYYGDALPIFKKRCGHCHTESSLSGISLLKFEDARSRTWAIRQSLISGRMPPWFGEGDAIKSPEPITARELDILMTWASGGAPEGASSQTDAPPSPEPATVTPDVVLPMPASFTLPSSIRAAMHEAVLPVTALRGRFLRAMDVRPSAPQIARRAEIILRSRSGDQIAGVWQPGDALAPLATDAGFEVTSGASVLLRMFYQRAEQNTFAVSDRSEVALYFAAAAARRVRTIALGDASLPPGARVYTQRIDGGSRAVALRPITGPQQAVARMTLVRTDGRRTPIARVEFRSGWQRRYVFGTPIELQAGDRIETHVTTATPDLWTTLTGEPPSKNEPVQIALELTR